MHTTFVLSASHCTHFTSNRMQLNTSGAQPPLVRLSCTAALAAHVSSTNVLLLLLLCLEDVDGLLGALPREPRNLQRSLARAILE